ncbi:MAG: diguanylate cyclase [Ruminiclostridium sp.]|nr:diguanylate cyclase [Ruminiclostridium sp.]
MRPTRSSHLPAVISVIATLLILAIAFTWYGSSIGGRIKDSNISYISENTSVLAAVFKSSFDEQTALLNSELSVLDSVSLSDADSVRNAAEKLTVSGTFEALGVMNVYGDAFTNSGSSYADYPPQNYAETMSSGTVIFLTDAYYFISVPLKQSGKITGAVFGAAPRDVLTSLLASAGSGMANSGILADKDGSVIAVSENAPYEVQKITNIFTDTSVSRPSKGSTSSAAYTFGVTESLITTAPVETLGLYIAQFTPNSELRKQASLIRADTAILLIIVIFAFIIMALSLMYLVRNYNDMMRSNERFKLVTVESQDLVFDYDYKKQELTLDGSIDNITDKRGKNTFSRAETLAMIERVHEEDKEVRRLVEELAFTDHTSVRGEFRYLCTDGTYSWFRMKGTVVRAHDGSPTRFIGSLINADDIMNREALLNSGNDTDPVTGIYCKAAFYNNVTAMLRSASDSDLFAIYIIDIDSFRIVNDDLGHATGDQVLADVAKKLCIVFSDKDFVGRIGGDEFAAFLHLSSKARTVGMNIIESKARSICEQIRATYSAKNKQVAISASVGVAIYPYSGRDYNTLFRCADRALRRVKAGSKDSYAVYSPDDEK